MALYEITKDALVDIAVTTFDIANIKERTDLQRLLRERIEIISPDTMVIAEEFGDWEDSRRRIDLLGIDRSGKLVVIELKRTDDGGFMDLQAVRYAAMVSTMTFEQAVSAHAAFLARLGRTDDARDGTRLSPTIRAYLSASCTATRSDRRSPWSPPGTTCCG